MTTVRAVELDTYWAGGWRTVGQNTGGTILLNTDWEFATVASPISNANMWQGIGGNVGNNTSTFEDASIVNVGGAHGKVINHFNAAGAFIDSANDYGMSMWIPLAQSVDEATISYDIRWLTPDPVTSSSTVASNPWGKGGKLPGLCGIAPGQGNPPSGGTSKQYGWSCRGMWITPAAGYSAEGPRLPVEWIGYMYDPLQPTSAFGQNRRTGVGWEGTSGVPVGTWANLKQYYKMNTVTTDGVTWSANGIHRMYLDGVLVYEKTNQVFRKYTAGRITHLAYDVYYGGGAVDWAPTGDVNTQIDNLLITTP